MATAERHRTLDIPRRDAGPHRNPGFPLELEWVSDIQVNRSAVERRAATIGTRRTVKKDWQAAWLLRAVTLMDLTTLAGDDTPGYVRRLCAKAIKPVRQDLLDDLGAAGLPIRTAAVCVYHQLVPTAVAALEGSGIPVAAVSTGFPAGLSPLPQRLEEIRASVAAGAREIDVVITRAHVLNNEWEALYDEVRAFREACGDAHIKVILGTGELSTLRNVARASMVAMMAGADFIKTSTGKESINAGAARRSRHDAHDPRIPGTHRSHRRLQARGRYPHGAKQALEWMMLMKEELGNAWLTPGLFRFGASTLLGDIERQLEHHVTGRYSANYRHPIA